MMKSSKDL